MRKSSRTFSRSGHGIHMNGKLCFLTFVESDLRLSPAGIKKILKSGLSIVHSRARDGWGEYFWPQFSAAVNGLKTSAQTAVGHARNGALRELLGIICRS
jgi:hypothetical protein